jgi:hypothetical protein
MGTSFHTYIGECCREWPMAAGFPRGRCGLCGESPQFKREDSACSCPYCTAGPKRSEPVNPPVGGSGPSSTYDDLLGAVLRVSEAILDPSLTRAGLVTALAEVEDFQAALDALGATPSRNGTEAQSEA